MAGNPNAEQRRKDAAEGSPPTLGNEQRKRLRAMKKWIVATLLLIATAANAQKTHNEYEPPNGPGAGQKLLAQFVGDWDVVKTFFPATGKPTSSKGTCKQYM